MLSSPPSSLGSYSDADPDRDVSPSALSLDPGMLSPGAFGDHFDRLPDSVLLLVFNKIADVKALGRCCVVSRRFHSLVPQVDNVLVRVDCVISDSADSEPPSPSSSTSDKPPGVLSHFARLVLGGIVRPLQALGQIIGPRKPSASDGAGGITDPSTSSSYSSSEVSHHSPTEVLRNFKEIRRLQIKLPSGELGVEDGVLLKWKADFGSTLHCCVILGASTVVPPFLSSMAVSVAGTKGPDGLQETDSGEDGQQCGEDNNGSIPELFYTNGSLKLRVVWTISSLIAASARHYLLQPIVADHGTLETLDLTDTDGQGVLCMNRNQLEELRRKPVSASGSSQRTLVPALHMRLWYAPHLELPGGLVLKGATLVAIQPSEQQRDTASMDREWISNAFEEPYGAAASLLLKRRTYCLEMNSF